MEITEPRRLYQQLAADLKERIEQGVYLVGDKLPSTIPSPTNIIIKVIAVSEKPEINIMYGFT